MPWKINIIENSIIELEIKGQITYRKAIAQANELISLSKKMKINRFLLNSVELCYENEIGIQISEIYTLPDYFINFGLPRSSKIALILPRVDYRIDDINFLASVFMRSGYSFALLNDKEKAIQYLMKEENCEICGCLSCYGYHN